MQNVLIKKMRVYYNRCYGAKVCLICVLSLEVEVLGFEVRECLLNCEDYVGIKSGDVIEDY